MGEQKEAGNDKIIDQNILMRTTNTLVKCANTSMKHYNFNNNDCASAKGPKKKPLSL